MLTWPVSKPGPAEAKIIIFLQFALTYSFIKADFSLLIFALFTVRDNENSRLIIAGIEEKAKQLRSSQVWHVYVRR